MTVLSGQMALLDSEYAIGMAPPAVWYDRLSAYRPYSSLVRFVLLNI
jgi:hypothetical protein